MTSELSDLLGAHPLPAVDGDKDDRGTALIVAGDRACPGAAILSATAALRAGAGKVQVVTHPDIALAIGIELPEALVVDRPTDGGVSATVRELFANADSVLIGPGLLEVTADEMAALGGCTPPTTPLILDAGALSSAPSLGGHRLIMCPNTAEAAELAGGGEPAGQQAQLAVQLAAAFDATVAVRGKETVVTDGARTWSAMGHPGLGTAGSGDVLAGVLAGLCARGLDPLAAVGWAVAIHAAAGTLLADGGPGYGYIAREIVATIPNAIAALAEPTGEDPAQLSGSRSRR